MRWLVYVHPMAMLGVIALGLIVLREGLRLRRARLRGTPADSGRHRSWARPFVTLVLLGFGAGLLSMTRLRGEAAFESVHAVFATAAVLSLGSAGALGLRLERRASPRVRVAHLACGALGLLCALAAAVAGIAILP